MKFIMVWRYVDVMSSCNMVHTYYVVKIAFKNLYFISKVQFYIVSSILS